MQRFIWKTLYTKRLKSNVLIQDKDKYDEE